MNPSELAIKDDWFGVLSGASNFGELPWIILGGSSPTVQPNSEVDHPGIMVQNTNAGTIRAAMYLGSGATQGLLDPALTFEEVCIMRCDMVDANTVLRVGMSSDWNVETPVNAIWFEKLATDVNWFAVTRSGSTQTRVDTGIPATTSWFKFMIRRISATELAFTLDSNPDVILSTNVPIAMLKPGTMSRRLNTVTANRYHDYFHLTATGLVR